MACFPFFPQLSLCHVTVVLVLDPALSSCAILENLSTTLSFSFLIGKVKGKQ